MRAGNNLFGQFTKAGLPKSNKTVQLRALFAIY